MRLPRLALRIDPLKARVQQKIAKIAVLPSVRLAPGIINVPAVSRLSSSDLIQVPSQVLSDLVTATPNLRECSMVSAVLVVL